jgi:hypothetical protein
MGPNIYAEEILLHAYAAYSGQSARAENMHEFNFFDQSDNTGDENYQKIPPVAPGLHLQVDVQPSQPILTENNLSSFILFGYTLYRVHIYYERSMLR